MADVSEAGAVPPKSTVPMSMEELIAKEREVASKMSELQRRERDVRLALQRMRPNWPVQEPCCCIQPMVYHSIPSEVPADRVTYVKACYANYFVTIFIIVLNLITAGVTMGTKSEKIDGEKDENDWGVHFGVAFLHLLGIPGAFIVWYFQIYKACSTGMKGKYRLAYLGVWVAILYDVFNAIGFIGYGGCGFLYALKAKNWKERRTPYIMGMVCAVIFLVQALFFGFYVFVRLRRYANQDEQRTLTGTAGQVANAVMGRGPSAREADPPAPGDVSHQV